MNSSIWPIDGTLTGTMIPDQSGPGNNENEGLLFITGVSPADAGHSWGGSPPISRGAVSIFYSYIPHTHTHTHTHIYIYILYIYILWFVYINDL